MLWRVFPINLCLFCSSRKDSGKALVEVQSHVTASVDSESDPNAGAAKTCMPDGGTSNAKNTNTDSLAVNETKRLSDGSGNPEKDLDTGKQDTGNQNMTNGARICSAGVLTVVDNQSINNFQVRSNSEIAHTLIEPNTQDDAKKSGSDIRLLSDGASKSLRLMSADPSTTVPVNAPITLPSMNSTMQASTISPHHQDQPVPYSSMRENNESRLPCDRVDSTEGRIKNTFPNQPSRLVSIVKNNYNYCGRHIHTSRPINRSTPLSFLII